MSPSDVSSPSIKEQPALRFIGLEAAFISAMSPDTNNSQVIPNLWTRFLEQAKHIEGRQGQEMYGVVCERPPRERNREDEMLYAACVRGSADINAPPGMVQIDVSPKTYAVFTHRGPIASLPQTLEHIFRDWLPTSGFKHSGDADIELYDERFCPDDDASEMEYWIPITAVAK